MKQYKRILSIGAHSLDAELLGGPVLIKQTRKGAHGTMVHVTQGRLEDPNATKEENDAYLESLKSQNQEAARRMGCDVNSLGYLSSQLPDEEAFVGLMVELFQKEHADLIITHGAGTMHRRHYYTHYTVTEAVKRCRKLGMDIDLIYGENCEDLINFLPQLYLPMNEEEVETWFYGLNAYDIFQGKVNDTPYVPYYRTMLQVRQIESGSALPVKAYMYASLIEHE